MKKTLIATAIATILAMGACVISDVNSDNQVAYRDRMAFYIW